MLGNKDDMILGCESCGKPIKYCTCKFEQEKQARKEKLFYLIFVLILIGVISINYL